VRLRILLIVLVCSLLAPSMALAAKSYSADRFDVDVSVQDDGSLLVTETVVFRFTGGSFDTVFRELVTDNTDGVIDIVASMDGQRFPAGKGPGQVDIERGRNVTINWHMQPTSDAVHTFVLSYHMLGVLRKQNDADVLSYRVLPTDHDYTIAASTVRITYPASTRLISEPAIARGKAEIASRTGEVVFRSTDIGRDDTLQVALRFEPGSILLTPPQWQAAQERQQPFVPYMLGLALLLVIGGSAGLVGYWRRFSRGFSAAPSGGLRTMRPPAERAPALAGMIRDEAADPQWQHALGTLLDLGRRGVLVIEQAEAQTRWSGQDFVVRQATQQVTLLPHEDALCKLLFADKKGWTGTVKMSQVSGAIAERWSGFTKALQGEMRAAGLFDPLREHVRRRLFVTAVVVLIAGLLAVVPAILLLNVFGGSVMSIPIALLILSCIVFVAGASFSVSSDAALQEKARWQAFASYLKDVAKGKEPFVGARLMEEYLPYAASFGLAAEWAKLFKQRGDEQVMAWFRPLTSAADGGSAAFIAMIAASSSVGAGGGAGGAGAGAAGGGASGAH
jgi:hypothetical protein